MSFSNGLPADFDVERPGTARIHNVRRRMTSPVTAIRICLTCLLTVICALPATGQPPAGDARNSSESSSQAAEVIADAEVTDGAESPLPVSANEIRRAVDSGEYVLFPRSRLHELQLKTDDQREQQPAPSPAIAHASYNATLSEQTLTAGTLQFRLDASRTTDSVILGPTNLRQLAFTVNGRPTASAALADGRLSLLTAADSLQLSATWSAEGTATGDGTRFELQLPPAAVTELTLTTDANIVVTSPNAIVRPAVTADNGSLHYTLHPRRSRLLTLICSRSDAPGINPVFGPVTLNTAFNVTEDSVFAEWALVFPPDLQKDSITFSVDPDCRITDILTDTGSFVSWKLSEEAPRRLTISRIRAGQVMTVRGTMDSLSPGVLRLPLLTNSSADSSQRLNATDVQLMVARDLAVRRLTLEGLYQQEVSFDSTGEQIIELRQYQSAAAAEIHVEPATASIHQRLLIHRPLQTPGQITVYAELEPRSDQTFNVSWQLSGAWQPTSVDDVTTGLPVYSRLRPSEDGSGDTLQIDLRTPASSIQPARLRIQFRSTQAIAPQTSSLPVLINDQYRSLGTWILAPSSSPFQTIPEAELIPNTQEELRRAFPWALDDLPDVGRLELTKTDRLPTSGESSQAAESAIPRAIVDYNLQISESLVNEQIRLQLAATEQLPESVKLLFPAGINVQISNAAPMEQLTSTGRISDNHWQEWQLTLPQTATDRLTHSVVLNVSRPVSSAEFAAIPRLPSSSDVTLTARNITDPGAGFARAELVSDSTGDTDSQSAILYPGVSVSIQRISSRIQLRFTRTRTEDESLRIRGDVRMMISQESGEPICHSLANLVLSRTGPVDALAVRWPKAFDTRIFVNDQPVSCPASDATTRILLPPDQPTTGIRILWKTPVESAGLPGGTSSVTLPEFPAAQQVELAHLIQVEPGDARLTTASGHSAADLDHTQHVSSPVVTSNPSIRTFLMNWELASQRGAASQLIAARDHQVVFALTSGRWVMSCGILVFLAVLLGHRLFNRPTLRTLVMLLLLGSLGAAYAGPSTVWCFYGWNAALCLLLIARTCGQALADWWNRVEPAESAPTDSAVSTMTASLLAVLLTGQAPQDAAPPVLINEAMQADSPIVFVRRDLVPGQATATDDDVRVRDISAQVRLEQGGGTEISVEATVASRRGIESTFTVPVESATLTECAFDGEPVAPVRGLDRQPQIRLPLSENTSGPNNSVWRLNRISYTLRSDVSASSGRIDIRIPLPWSARTQLTLESPDDSILNARLVDGPSGDMTSDIITFPPQYNRGPLELQLVTQQSQSEMSDQDWTMDVTCRVRVTDDRTTIRSRYRLVTPQLLPEEVRLPIVPGYQPGTAVTPDETTLNTTVTGRYLTIQGSRQQLSDFEVTWEASRTGMNVDRTIPRAALAAPAHCSSGRTLLAVDVAEPFEVAAASQDDNALRTSPLTRQELDARSISPSSACFEIEATDSDILLELGLQTTRRIADSVEQSLVVGVHSLAWSCQCNMEVTGPLIFRQQLQVPRHLLIDDVNVSGNRVRSWSVQDGSLLVTFREGTRGSVQLSVRGVMQIPADGLIEVMPVQLEATEIVESSFLISATRDAAVQVDDASGTEQSNPIVAGPFVLNPYPVKLPIVDSTLPVKLSTRDQEKATARLLVLTHSSTSVPYADMALRIQAGDQSWDGRISLPDELAEATVDWITDDVEFELPVEGGQLPAQRLPAGDTAFLVLRGVRIPTEGAARRLPLPDLEPDVRINRVQLFDRSSDAQLSDQSAMPWILKTLKNSGIVSTPAGVTERGRSEHYDARDNSIHIAGLQSDNSLPNSVARRAVRSVGVTRVYSTSSSLAGSTDILIDFGDAEESQCSVPPDVRIISCELDGTALPETADSNVISVRRSAQVQRLRIHWLREQRAPGYLPRWMRLAVPTIDALNQDQYLTIDSPPGLSWTHDDSLEAITPAQLDTRISTALAGTNADAAQDTETPDTVARFLADQQASAPQTGLLFEAAGDRAAGVRYRQTLPWTRWIPVMTLGAVWLTVTGRQASLRRRTQIRSRAITSDLSDHSTSDSAVSSDSTPSTPV